MKRSVLSVAAIFALLVTQSVLAAITSPNSDGVWLIHQPNESYDLILIENGKQKLKSVASDGMLPVSSPFFEQIGFQVFEAKFACSRKPMEFLLKNGIMGMNGNPSNHQALKDCGVFDLRGGRLNVIFNE
jgi:hypothetical protein